MTATHLIGRETALEVITDAINSIHEAPSAILVTGERGIGRTTFVSAAREMAIEAGFDVIETMGTAAESGLSFAALHRLIKPLIPKASALPSSQSRALLTAIGIEAGPEPDPLMVSLGTLGLIAEAASRQPVLITVDDAHWLDAASLQVLSFLARRLDGRVMIIATSFAATQIAETASSFRELLLNRLDAAAVNELLDECAGQLDEAHRDWVTISAVGNPMAVVELAGTNESPCTMPIDPFSAAVPLTPKLERVWGSQLDGLSSEALDILLVAALELDGSVQAILAAASVFVGRPVTVDDLDELASAGIVRYDENQLSLSHPLVRSVVVLRESVTRHRAAHTALGQAVVMSAAQRTWHRASGATGRDDLIAADLETLGADAAKRGDNNGAIKAWERSAQLSTYMAERGRRLLLAASRAAEMGQFATMDRLLTVVVEGELTEFDQIRASLLRETWIDHVDGSERVHRLCTQAQAAAAAGESRLAVSLIHAAAASRYAAHVNSSALSEVTRLADSIGQHTEHQQVLSLLALLDPIRYGRAVRAALQKVDIDAVSDGGTLLALSIAARGVGDYSHGLEFLDQAHSALRRAGLKGQLERLLTLAIDMKLEVGDWSGAEAALKEIDALRDQGNRAVRRSDALVTAAKVAALRGQVVTALELLVEAEHIPTVRRGSPALAGAQTARGIAYLASGRHLDAYNALRRVFDPKSASHHYREQFGAVMYLAEAAVHCGHHAGAQEIVARVRGLSELSTLPLLVAQIQYADAVLANDGDAEMLFLKCLSSELAAWPWARARTQLAYGRWLRRQRRVSQSRVPLEAAYSVFQSIGAEKWAEEARDELEAAGQINEEEQTGTPLASLSAQELKIARLAAAGMSNTEIGQQLCLSPRTVGSHLYRIFPKLGITARAQISAQLSQPVG
jgi:DNA-binding CsgD family transcriptional regulator